MKIAKNIEDSFVGVSPRDLSKAELDGFLDFLLDYTDYVYAGFQDLIVFCRDDIDKVYVDLVNVDSKLSKELQTNDDADTAIRIAATAGKLLNFCGPRDSYIFIRLTN